MNGVSTLASRKAVCSGDLGTGDQGGVVEIPRSISGAVIFEAVDKIEGANVTRDEMRAGVTLGDVYRRYEIL